ncbi:purine-nucleoside phosphorylase [Desulfosarcina sp. OttesenSCG-928-A07]|nr:purine-nucleoside phosphorylase [Desulfosarcina sp. OttesenSCG-928-G17]MDL2329654.1 purine-nucleoside phosphorylase [Desulfosarcina sp. OttesenSCG-928-A07]
MPNMIKKVNEAVHFLKQKLPFAPLVGVITGTGLRDAMGPLTPSVTLNYGSIPHFPVSTVVSHAGHLIAGLLDGHPVLVMQGRFHLYEGYTPAQVSFPVRVMQELGIRNLIVSNAAGGITPFLAPGDLMMITDHINLTGENPLTGPNVDAWGPRFPDMTTAWHPDLMACCRRAAGLLGESLKAGVYAGLRGPSLETPAEIRFLKTIGADAVGLSTLMEVIAAVHGGIRVLGLSVITNLNDPDHPHPASLEAIVDAANQAAPRLGRLIRGVIHEIHRKDPS